ncbi:MAG: c-type cytochrome [Duganella sp.]
MINHRRRLILTTVAATLATAGAVGGAVGLIVLYGGFYNIGATKDHFQPVYSLLERGLLQSVRSHARDVQVPDAIVNEAKTPPGAPTAAYQARPQVVRGAGLYRDNCVVCHGAPGVAQGDIGKSMQPVPGPLSDAARRWRPNELYWITRHGIKMSGMPAWEYHLAEDDLWAVVGFLVALPSLTPKAYADITALSGPQPRAQRTAYAQPDIARGRLALTQYACHACHMVPGVTGSETAVGPSLDGIGKRKFIANDLPNTPDNLARFIRAPQAVDPHGAMPDMGVTESDARDMAAYLLAQ